MRRVSLILPVVTPSAIPAGYLEKCVASLRGGGYEVDTLVVLEDEAVPQETAHADGSTWVTARGRGLVSSTMSGFALTSGDVILVLDPTRGYYPDDLPSLVVPIVDDQADLVVARGEGFEDTEKSRGLSVTRRLGVLVGRVARSLLGVSDVLSGLVALSPAAVRSVLGTFDPVGSRFTLDLLTRARARKIEVPVRFETATPPVSFTFDDLRHVKRLADDRYGNASRLFQFCAVGASGMVVDLTFYALFQLVFSKTSLAHRPAPWIGGTLDLAVAGALAIALALTWNFSFNRRLTFNYARGGSILRQYFTYALSNALGIVLSLSLRLYLPSHLSFFSQHKLAAAVVGIVAATGVSFSLARWVVFSQRGVSRDQARIAARKAGVVKV